MRWPWSPRPSEAERDRDERMAQAQRRAETIQVQVNLANMGVTPVDIGGVTMWSASGSTVLHPDPELALDELGLAVIITIDGVVFVEPWG